MTTTEDTIARSNRLMHEFIENDVKPNAEAIATIAAAGKLPVLVHNLSETGKTAARVLGWDGTSPVFAMPSKKRKIVADNLGRRGDTVSKRWLLADRPGRLFVIWNDGTLLLNWGSEWSVEPGSLGTEHMS